MKLFSILIVVAFISGTALADTCGKSSCKNNSQDISICSGLKRVKIRAKCEEKKGGGAFSTGFNRKLDRITCEATLPNGSKIEKFYDVSFPRCSGSGPFACHGQSSRGPEQKKLMTNIYNNSFLSYVASNVTAGCEGVNQCELMLKKDPDLRVFASALSGDGKIDQNEAISLQTSFKKYDRSQEGNYRLPRHNEVSGVLNSTQVHQGYNQLSEFNLAGDKEILTFKRRFYSENRRPGSPVGDIIFSPENRTLTVERVNEGNRKRVIVKDSLGLSNVELVFINNKCYPYKRSSDSKFSQIAPQSFDFSQCQTDTFNCEGLPFWDAYAATRSSGGSSKDQSAGGASEQ